MRLTIKSLQFSYKTLFWYSVVIIALLLVAAPVLANTTPGSNLLDFSRSAEAGSTIQSAQTLSQGLNVSHLNPGQEIWYTFSRDIFNDPEFAWVSLALRYETEARLEPQQVNFEVFARPQSSGWFQAGDMPTPGNVMGSGQTSPLRGNQNLVETFWSGQVAEQQQYLVRVFNESPFGLDYTLEAKAEQVAASGATPAGLNKNKPNAIPQNIRRAAWTLTAQAVTGMSAIEAAEWMQKAQAVGWIVTEGTTGEAIPSPGEANPLLLWQLTAQAIEGQEAADAAEWLVQADSMGWLSIPFALPVNPNLDDVLVDPAGGDDGGTEPVEEAPAVPAPPDDVYAPVNIYPNNPLPFDFNNANSGRLAPYGEHWYELSRDDLDDDLIENMKMTMFFTPIQGFMSNRINFEIFPAGQYHIWQRGDANYMENLGVGTWVSRDEDSHTGERLWNGTLVDGDRYLVKVKNGTPEEVDYYLFPNDVENAELGNPTLHAAVTGMGRVPYAASPPTRPARPPIPGENPVEALPLETGTTEGELEAGEELWYKFSYSDPHNEETPEHDFKIYLTNTPLDGIRARHADFAIYPGGQLHLYTRGTIDELDPLGHSAPSPYPLDDKKGLQVLWDGQLMEGQVYYIKVWNHDIGPLEYELEFVGGP